MVLRAPPHRKRHGNAFDFTKGKSALKGLEANFGPAAKRIPIPVHLIVTTGLFYAAQACRASITLYAAA